MSFLAPALAEDEWLTEYRALEEQARYDQAYAIVTRAELEQDPRAAQIRGLLLGSGVLSSGRDRCAAVLNLEFAHRHGRHYLRATLDYLYGGDWPGIAALEGNAEALYIVGSRLFSSEVQENALLVYNNELQLTDAYRYLYASMLLGYDKAAEHELVKANSNATVPAPMAAPMTFKEVMCPVRFSKSQ
jgi:hypothetical protein